MNSLIIICFLFIFLIAILMFAFQNESDIKNREIALLKKQIQNRDELIEKQLKEIKNIKFKNELFDTVKVIIYLKKKLVDKYDLIKELVDRVD